MKSIFKECSKLGKQYMLETSNSFDAAIVTAICITAVLKNEKGQSDLEPFKGAIFTHIIKTGATKVIPISDVDEGSLAVALRRTFDIGNLRTNSEEETYRNGQSDFILLRFKSP